MSQKASSKLSASASAPAIQTGHHRRDDDPAGVRPLKRANAPRSRRCRALWPASIMQQRRDAALHRRPQRSFTEIWNPDIERRFDGPTEDYERADDLVHNVATTSTCAIDRDLRRCSSHGNHKNAAP